MHMLTVDDLINIAYIPFETDISLQLYVDFYEQYLCKKIFKFTLKNGTQVKLFFKDTTEIFHISGIEHIYEGIPMDGKRFIELVKDKKVDIAQLKVINANAYKDYIDRIRSFACIDTLIKNCEYLWYADGKIPGSTIKVKYLLLKGMDGKNIHLGIDTYKENRPFFSRTLLVTEGNIANKFIDKADERLRVSRIEIVDKNTNELIELIDRDMAEKKAIELIDQCVLKWEKDMLAIAIKDFCIELANKLDIVKKISELFVKESDKINTVAEFFISNNKEVLEILQEIQVLDNCEKKEWKDLLLEVISETACIDSLFDDHWEDFVYKYCIDDLVEYIEVNTGKFIKYEATPKIKKMLDAQKQYIRDEIDKYDNYWSGKIVGEYIRERQNEYIKGPIHDVVKRHVENRKQIYVEILLKNIPLIKKEKLKNEFTELISSKIQKKIGDNIYFGS